MAFPQRKTGSLAPKAVGVASARSADLVDTATLIRGRVYSYRYKGESYHFEDGIETVLEDKDGKPLPEFAKELEELHTEVRDGDGDTFEKPLFYVQRGVTRPPKNQGPQTRRQITRLPPKPLPRPVR